MSSLGGRLWEVIPSESLDHNGQSLSSLQYDNYRDLTHAPMPCNVSSCKSQFRRKNQTPRAPIEKFPFLAQDRDTITSKHLIIHFSFCCLSIGRLWEVKNRGKFQAFSFTEWSRSLTRGCRLQEIQIQWFDHETFGILAEVRLMLSLIYQTWDLFTKVLLNLVGEELLFIPIAEEWGWMHKARPDCVLPECYENGVIATLNLPKHTAFVTQRSFGLRLLSAVKELLYNCD